MRVRVFPSKRAARRAWLRITSDWIYQEPVTEVGRYGRESQSRHRGIWAALDYLFFLAKAEDEWDEIGQFYFVWARQILLVVDVEGRFKNWRDEDIVTELLVA